MSDPVVVSEIDGKALTQIFKTLYKSVEVYLKPPGGDVIFEEHPADATQLVMKHDPDPISIWRGDVLVFSNSFNQDVDVKFNNTMVFGLSAITIPPHHSTILTVADTAPLVELSLTVPGLGAGEGPQMIIVKPPIEDD
jgi:hypothetical protein